MPKIIFKAHYLSAHSAHDRAGFINYIATRTGVVRNKEKLINRKETQKQQALIENLIREFPTAKNLSEYQIYQEDKNVFSASELIEAICEDHFEQIGQKEEFISYIAERPGVVKDGNHGLFSIESEHIDLQEIKERIKNHKGRIWTHVLSLTREDASLLGFEEQAAWKALLCRNHGKMAEIMKIDPQNFHWFAAFHDTAHHPHIHIVMYSDNPQEGYLTKKGIEKMRKMFVSDIFHEQLQGLYQDKDELKKQLKREIEVKLNNLENLSGDLKINQQIFQLTELLKNVSGKKVYGYLPKKVKQQVDEIMKNLIQLPEVKELLEKWQELADYQYSFYSDHRSPTLSLVDDKTFRSLKNQIIKIADQYNQSFLEKDSIQKDELQFITEKENYQEEINLVKNSASAKVQHENVLLKKELFGSLSEVHYFNPTIRLFHHLANIIRQDLGIKPNVSHTDHKIKFKERLRRIALGQNEKDTQHY